MGWIELQRICEEEVGHEKDQDDVGNGFAEVLAEEGCNESIFFILDTEGVEGEVSEQDVKGSCWDDGCKDHASKASLIRSNVLNRQNDTYTFKCIYWKTDWTGKWWHIDEWQLRFNQLASIFLQSQSPSSDHTDKSKANHGVWPQMCLGENRDLPHVCQQREENDLWCSKTNSPFVKSFWSSNTSDVANDLIYVFIDEVHIPTTKSKLRKCEKNVRHESSFLSEALQTDVWIRLCADGFLYHEKKGWAPHGKNGTSN